MEVVKLHGSHGSSDPRGHGLAGVAHKVGNGEQSRGCCCCGRRVLLWSDIKVPEKNEQEQEVSMEEHQ